MLVSLFILFLWMLFFLKELFIEKSGTEPIWCKVQTNDFFILVFGFGIVPWTAFMLG